MVLSIDFKWAFKKLFAEKITLKHGFVKAGSQWKFQGRRMTGNDAGGLFIRDRVRLMTRRRG
jgi:hypothetical protein